MAKALGVVLSITAGDGDEVILQMSVLLTGDDTNGGAGMGISVSVDPAADVETVRAAISDDVIAAARDSFEVTVAPDDITIPAFAKG
jgi:hypothetical protein